MNRKKKKARPSEPRQTAKSSQVSNTFKNLLLATTLFASTIGGGLGLYTFLSRPTIPPPPRRTDKLEEDDTLPCRREIKDVIEEGRREAEKENKPHLLLLLEHHIHPQSLFLEQEALAQTQAYTRVFETSRLLLEEEMALWAPMEQKFKLLEKLDAESAHLMDPQKLAKARVLIENAKRSIKINNMALLASSMPERERSRLVYARPDNEQALDDPQKLSNIEFEKELKKIDAELLKTLQGQEGSCVAVIGGMHGRGLQNDPVLRKKFDIQAVNIAEETPEQQDAEILILRGKLELQIKKLKGIPLNKEDEAVRALVERSEWQFDPNHVRQLIHRPPDFPTQIDAWQRYYNLQKMGPAR